jgi:hypothetical protein
MNNIPQLNQQEVEKALTRAHENIPSSFVAGRNVVAGYARGWGLQFGTLFDELQRDPIYQEATELMGEVITSSHVHFMNLLLILKYGLKNLKGDIIDLGAYASEALFLACVAKRLGFQGRIYALNRCENINQLERYQEDLGLTNLIIVQGEAMENIPKILEKSGPIVLAHLDCYSYDCLTHLITALKKKMHREGGYLVFSGFYHLSSIEAFHAIEDFIQEESVFAEQNYPHFVYRFPHLGSHT